MFNKFDYRLTADNFYKIPSNFIHDIKMCKQRIQRGWCEDDAWDIKFWFINTVPDMLQYYKENRVGSPVFLDKNSNVSVLDSHKIFSSKDTPEENKNIEPDCHKVWDEILDEMIFNFREGVEETCSKKNKYEDEYMPVFEEFINKYGLFGEGLETEEEKEDAKKTGSHEVHLMREIPEYADIDRKHFNEEIRLEKYREKMRQKGLKLFCKYFENLWD